MIKTTQCSAVKAYNTINKLSSGFMPISAAYKFFKIKQALKNQYDFQAEQEQLLFDQFKPEYNDGKWTFSNEKDRDSFVDKLNEIDEMPVEIDIDKQYIALDDRIIISIEDMETLEGFVVFGGQSAK